MAGPSPPSRPSELDTFVPRYLSIISRGVRSRSTNPTSIHSVSTYVGQRLQRLEGHGHARNLYETGLYELVEDPREDGEE